MTVAAEPQHTVYLGAAHWEYRCGVVQMKAVEKGRLDTKCYICEQPIKRGAYHE